MQKENLLKKLIFETPLFDLTVSVLSENEEVIIKRYLKDKKEPEEIAEETGLTAESVKRVIDKGVKKILLTSQNHHSKELLVQILSEELRMLKDRFKKELKDAELTSLYEQRNIPISSLLLSARAEGVLFHLKVKTLHDLSGVTLYEIKRARNAGPKTVDEIVSKAAEFGIRI